MKLESIRKAAGTGLALGLALLLAACILSPGKFTSTMDVRKSGAFTFTYKGEIYILGLNQLAKMGEAANAEFTPTTCYEDEGDFGERECTEEELEQQRNDWALMQQNKKAEDERTAKGMSSLFGGIDPSDPQAAEEIAAKLRRQHGFNTVTYKGEGLYEVDFAVTSKLGHDFAFPTFEGFPMANFFVVANVRDGNTVKIEAPGFSVQSNNSGSGNGFMQMASIFGAGDPSNEELAMPALEGTFTVTTDAAILANNTDEGPKASAAGQQLSWIITKRTTVPPSALIKFGP